MSDSGDIGKSKGDREQDVIRAATVVAGGLPCEFEKNRTGIKQKIVWVGVVDEMTDIPGVEIAKYLGCAHSVVHEWKRRWYEQLNWRERHGWLLLAEHISGRTASVQSSTRLILDSVSSQSNSMTPIGCFSTQRLSGCPKSRP